MTNITAAELKKRLEDGEQLTIIDVREPSEYAEYNMGGKLIPLGQIMNLQIDDLEEYREKELILHCKAGMRSMQACMMLEQAGFTNLVNLSGGILAWQQLNQ
jgi:rhodanese-related sulfurtransferase